MDNANRFLTLKEASDWASAYTGKKVTVSNISYLIQYGRIKKHGENGNPLVSVDELKEYYNSYLGKRELAWKEELGEDLNWALSFDQYKESETTKHVHRLHPYKGKFIPQLVEYFLDEHVDDFKKEVFFNKGDIVLDPFCGSGTTLVQANELGIHAIGIDISEFNAIISNAKLRKYNIISLKREFDRITESLKSFISETQIIDFDNELTDLLNEFNNKYFPVPDFKFQVKSKLVDEKMYGLDKEKEFLKTFRQIVKKYNIKLIQDKNDTFLDKWYIPHIRNEIEFIKSKINQIRDEEIKELLQVILSRTARSCRATTHSDLATLKKPVVEPYYCSKHAKICKPLFSILKWWETYTSDTLKRLSEFSKTRTDTYQICLQGDSRVVDIFSKLEEKMSSFAELAKKQKIKGIFTSPPYVGLIDYHEQHAYAYDLFGYQRRDEEEIGPLFKGQGKEARESYVEGISKVLLNCKRFLSNDYHVFLVANDKFNLYPLIADKAGMKIIQQFKRPVLNRTEKDKSPYAEIIFHLKEK